MKLAISILLGIVTIAQSARVDILRPADLALEDYSLFIAQLRLDSSSGIRWRHHVEDANNLSGLSALVVLPGSSGGSFSPAELSNLQTYAAGGGRLILIGSSDTPSWNQELERIAGEPLFGPSPFPGGIQLVGALENIVVLPNSSLLTSGTSEKNQLNPTVLNALSAWAASPPGAQLYLENLPDGAPTSLLLGLAVLCLLTPFYGAKCIGGPYKRWPLPSKSIQSKM